MGTCPKCGKHTDELVVEPVTLQVGADIENGWAYRCAEDDCAAIISVERQR